jgi:hypothetical protein
VSVLSTLLLQLNMPEDEVADTIRTFRKSHLSELQVLAQIRFALLPWPACDVSHWLLNKGVALVAAMRTEPGWITPASVRAAVQWQLPWLWIPTQQQGREQDCQYE